MRSFQNLDDKLHSLLSLVEVHTLQEVLAKARNSLSNLYNWSLFKLL